MHGSMNIVTVVYNKRRDIMETYKLQSGYELPKVGFGTWRLSEEDDVAYNSVLHSLKSGYRHIDTAQVYENEASVGRAINDSDVPREEIFLTTKVWNDKEDYESAIASIEKSLETLNVDYVDLLLIHWPNPEPLRQSKGEEAWVERNREVWRALEEAYDKGLARSIGVSNFMLHHLESLLETVRIKPMVNQIRLAPGLTQDEVVEYCRDNQIVLEAYSPLGSGTAFNHPTIIEIAERYDDKSPAQIALRWSIEKGFVPLPRSKTPANIEANINIFDFELTDEEIAVLDKVEGVIDPVNPDEVDF